MSQNAREQSSAHGVVFATVVFQGRVEASHNLTEPELIELKSEIMPRFTPLDFRTRTEFRGLKVFSLASGYIVVAYITDSKEGDRWGRPLLRADAVLFKQQNFNKLGRDIIGIRDFLNEMRVEDVHPRVMHERFAKRIEDYSVVRDNARFERYLQRLNTLHFDFLVGALSAVLTSRKIIMYPPQNSELYDLTRFFFLTLPIRRLSTLTFSDICNNPMDERSEDLIVSDIAVERGFQLLAKQFPAVINLSDRTVKGASMLSTAKAIVSGLLDDPWYTFERVEQYEVIQECIYELFDRQNPLEIAISEKMAKMTNSVERFAQWLEYLNRSRKEVSQVIQERNT